LSCFYFIFENKFLLKRLSTVTSSSYSAISGAASSIIQNFQIQNMLKETAQAENL